VREGKGQFLKIKSGPQALDEAIQALRAGRLVAIPTETVYGLAGRADQDAAVESIYAVKGRPSTNPLIVHVLDALSARQWVVEWPESAEKLASRFWPGPLTMILKTDERLPSRVRAGLKTIGLRVPAHPLAQELLRKTGLPLAAPSANRSGHISPTRAEHVVRSFSHLDEKNLHDLAFVLDGGAALVGVESTIVDLTDPLKPVLLRPGQITLAELEKELGIQVKTLKKDFSVNEVQPSPGLLSRHYAPDAETVLFNAGEIETVREKIKRRESIGERSALLLLSSMGHWKTNSNLARIFSLPQNPKDYARDLYNSLHEAEDWGAGFIAIELPPPEAQWHAVQDRLKRAATVE